jgi:FAD/FMN-containing dehydrogenase
MISRPANKEELAALLRSANERRASMGQLDLHALNRVLQHTPEDMTVTVETGMTLADLQSALARRGQWLPIDPPGADALTIAELIATNTSGPRRYGFGTIRDHLIGLQVVLADGRLVRSGGKVVKNVAGFDLLKLFVGAHDTLGFVVEATFKLLPLPETERFGRTECRSLEDCRRVIDSVFATDVTPVVLDCHNVGRNERDFEVVVGFSGTCEDVDWQLSRAATLGFAESATLDHDGAFWNGALSNAHRWSVLPSKLTEAIRELGNVTFVARAGNGVIYYRDGQAPPKSKLPAGLMRRVKETFDPNQILADFPEC